MGHVYAADGSLNVTVVNGASKTRRYAANGSVNVVEASGSTPVGLLHPCGALWCTLSNGSTPHSFYAADGSMRVTDNGTQNGAQKVTVVTGAFGAAAGEATGLLLVLTKA